VSYIQQSGRDSISQFALGGLDHHFNPRLSGSVRAGGQFRSDDQGGSRTSPFFEGSLNYVLGKQTSVSLSSRYSLEETDIAVSQSRETFRMGLTAKYDFTPRISGSLSAYYHHDDYQNFNFGGTVTPGFTEDSFNTAISLRYAVTRYFGVEAGYNYTDVASDIPFRQYSRNSYWGGLNVSF
jgi:hypothetical protein